MHYAILCYHSEEVVTAWTKEQNEEVMGRLEKVRQRIAKEGKLGPVARLLPTTAATTLRKDRDPPLILDGPFAETKEQFLGFYIVDVADLDEALGIARNTATMCDEPRGKAPFEALRPQVAALAPMTA